MTKKERLINTLKFKGVDRIPMVEIGTWGQTAQRWEGEGLPAWVGPENFFKGNDYFKLDGTEVVDIDALVPYPRMEEKILQEDEEHVLFTDEFGRTRRALKTGTVRGTRLSMDQYIDFPVKDRQTFLEYIKKYSFNFEERYPRNWEEIKLKLKNTDKPLHLLDPMVGTFGFYSMLRNLMGTEGVSYMFYDDPELICECLDFLTEFITGLFRKALNELEIDYYYIHEDMCYNTGPLVSPEIFRKMFLPNYKKFVEFLKSNGVKVVLVDTDGNFEKLIPIFLEAGVDGFGPIEAAAGMDPVKLRNQYGSSFSMIGGIDKREIAKGKREIEEELKRKITPLIDKGGYIPTIDHSIPPSVSLENFLYYLELKRKMIFC